MIVVKAKQFKLPLEQNVLNETFNIPGILILEEKVFQDRTGDVVVYLKWEEIIERREDFFA